MLYENGVMNGICMLKETKYKLYIFVNHVYISKATYCSPRIVNKHKYLDFFILT